MASFKVDASRRQERMRADGGTVQEYVVWIETDLGATGSVKVPASVWEGENLIAYLQTEADKLDKAFLVVNGV